VSPTNLRAEWEALVARRPAFGPALGVYDPILTAWLAWTARPGDPESGLRWTGEECRARWRRGIPLIAEAPPRLAAPDLEELLGVAMEAVAAVGVDGAGLARLAEAWDRGAVDPRAFFPGHGRIGSLELQQETGLTQGSLAFLACVSLRPVLERHFAPCRAHLTPGTWDLGVCPFCGAPPAFSDLIEGGQRLLACHLCEGAWSFSRLRCPLCGSHNPQDLVRLLAEEAEEGYAVAACKACGGYIKEVDRRARWNAGSALVEDWGSPHLDLVARRSSYWRAVPTLLQLHAE